MKLNNDNIYKLKKFCDNINKIREWKLFNIYNDQKGMGPNCVYTKTTINKICKDGLLEKEINSFLEEIK